MVAKKHVLVISTCTENWGGSEELWAKTIPFLLENEYKITVCKEKIDYGHPQFKKLQNLGVSFYELNPLSEPTPEKIIERELVAYIHSNKDLALVLISQGINFDGLGIGYICLTQNIPYALIAQKAVETFWPYHVDRTAMRNVYLNAERAYFVSKHNLNLTEEQFGVRFNNAQVISNPVKVNRQILPYPNTENGYRLACIGRFLIIDKGQDILIRIMAQEKWKARPIKISFIGAGTDKVALMQLANLLNAANVEFLDPQEDIEALWNQYHALILPSRFEGTPLVLLEAMALGRTAIVSTAGGNSELVADGKSGFIGYPNESEFDAVMERAWQERDKWPAIGAIASQTIKDTIPEIPEKGLAKSIDDIINNTRDLVTVIIPTYNRAGIVENAIKSVLNQTYPHIQLIVADDGSTDETDELMTKYPQITYLKLDHGGQAHARNAGLRHAKGNYIATLDSDDTWEPDFVKNCKQMIDDNQLDFAFANWTQIHNHNIIDRFSICHILKNTLDNSEQSTILLEDKQLRELYLLGCPSPSSSLLFKRSSLQSNWTSGLRIADDWCLLMDIIYNKPCKAAFTKDVLWHKKVDGKNIYEGRDHIELVTDLWIHDVEILFRRFQHVFTPDEKKQVQDSLKKNYSHYSYHELRDNKRKKYWHVLKDKKLLVNAVKSKMRKELSRLKFIKRR